MATSAKDSNFFDFIGRMIYDGLEFLISQVLEKERVKRKLKLRWKIRLLQLFICSDVVCQRGAAL